MTEKSVVNALPKLPGFDFSALNQPPTFNKSHGFAFVQGMPVVKAPASQAQQHQVRPSDPVFSEFAILNAHPQWKTLTDKVLRFFGYFTERVEESAVEKLRTRRVCLQFYLCDGTVTVTETPSTVNSGLRAGCIMSRHKEPHVVASALKVGGTVSMRALVITLVDCDPATRRFFDTMGRPQPAAIEYPPDAFEALQARPAQVVDAAHVDMRRVVEMIAAASSGHQSTKLTPEERVRAQSFLKHDREVLNFSATWDRRLFRVNFFLADGTMSVTTLHTPNDGRDPNAAFVKRGVIPKGKFELNPIDTCSPAQRAAFYTDLDLATGRTINLFGRDFFLFSCDPFTRSYYKRVHGVDMADVAPGPLEADEQQQLQSRRRDVQWEVPPPTGFGSEEDSLGSYRSIVPKAPRKDYGKYIARAGDVLRYAAVLANPLPEDECRRFIACFYIADDTVSVYEYSVRNSGHSGGKVFARCAVPGVTEKSFFTGAELKLGGYVFRLTHSDERTQKFLEDGIPMGGVSNARAEELLARVRHVLLERFCRITDAYRHFNSSKSGLGIDDMKRMLAECDVRIEGPGLLNEVMELADRDRDGVVSLQEFVENVLRQSLTSRSATTAAAAATASHEESRANARSFQELQEAKSRREFADAVLLSFIAKLEARRTFIVDIFRIVSDKSIDGLIGADTFRQVVQDRLGLNMPEKELEALIYRFFYVPDMVDWEKRRLSLREFRKVIEA